MVETLKILGQQIPAATTNTTLYTVPAKTRAVISALTACETGGGANTIRIFIVPSGGSAATSNALYYGYALAANTTLTARNIAMGPGDLIVVYASSANVCFQVFGDEIS